MLHLTLHTLAHSFFHLSEEGLLAKKATCASVLLSKVLLEALQVDPVALPLRLLRGIGD